MDSRFRYIDPDGSETAVAGIPELMNEISKGKVLASTMLFDSTQQRWIIASQHDAFQAATAMMAAAAIGEDYPPNDPVVIDVARQTPPVLPQSAQSDLPSSTADSALEHELQSLNDDFTAAVAKGIEPSLRQSYQSQLGHIHARHGTSAPVIEGASTSDQVKNPFVSISEKKERSNHRGLKAHDHFYKMRASAGQRLVGILLDIVFLYGLGWAVGSALGAAGMEELVAENGGVDVFGAILWFLYFAIQEGITGKTLGKRICGTVAVQLDGTPLSIGRAIGRTLCRVIPFEAFTFLGDDGYPRGWHDRITKTQVLSSEKFRAPSAHPVAEPRQNTA